MNAAVNGGRHQSRPAHRKQPGQTRYTITRPEVPPHWQHRQRLRIRLRRDWWLAIAVPVFTVIAFTAVLRILRGFLG